MKTIIGFDSWTEGARYFERLVPAFEKHGYRLVLVHIGSWGHDVGRPKEEMIGNLCVRDISYYQNKGLGDIFDSENPSAVLFMSTRAITHMAFNRYAREKKIPTCHIYHGLVMVQASGEGERAYRINYFKHLNLLSTRIAKNISKIIPTYIKSLLETNGAVSDWLGLLKYIVRRGIGVSNNKDPYVNDTSTDIGCVYTAADVEHMHRNYRMPLSSIHVVGNPDISVFGVDIQDIGYALTRSDFSDTLIYIDTALVEAGVVFDSTNDFIQHILHTRDELIYIGFKLSVKLHPAHYKTETPNILLANGITLCCNDNFIDQLKISRAVIVEPSSAAFIPALIGVPVLLAQYGKLSKQAYGPVLRTYPRSRSLINLSSIRTILSAEQNSISVDSVMQWIEINSGPMPAEDMPERAVRAMCDLIAKKTQSSNG
jgi:hypothetical protein